jgi:hypothetical protein
LDFTHQAKYFSGGSSEGGDAILKCAILALEIET